MISKNYLLEKPHVEGLTPMEASSLVHEENSHLADRLLLTPVTYCNK